MTVILMTIHILDERYKRKRIAEIEDKLKGRYKMTFEEAIELIEEECRVEAEDGFLNG